MCSCSWANDWGIKTPWEESEISPPEVKPYELPTLQGTDLDFKDSIPALLPAPKINPDDVFNAVLKCYPEKSKFKIDISLVAGVKSSMDEYGSDEWPAISEHYIGIVGKMPIYSSTEQSRERQWEYQRRNATASAVSAFTKALADRNYAYRLMGLYLSLEARSKVRVEKGIASVDEQVGLLQKVADTHRDVLAYEAKIVEERLALVSLCEEQSAEVMNIYLKKLSHLPTKQELEKNK
jgi:hypothetical protein